MYVLKLLVVGGGGREHAIIRSLKKNPTVTEIFACPGNGGIAADALCTGIAATDIDKIVAFAENGKLDLRKAEQTASKEEIIEALDFYRDGQ